MSHLWWVPLPGGVDAQGDGVLRVLVIPVIDEAADEVALSWPPQGLDDATLSVDVDGSTDAPSGSAMTTPLKADLSVVAGAWQEFFGTITVAEPGPAPARVIDVAKTQEQYVDVRRAYAAAAQSLTSEDHPEALAVAARTAAQSVTAERSRRSTPKSHPRSADRPVAGGLSTSVVDFNLAIGLLREHPPALSALGLLFELSVPAATLAGWPASGFLQISWSSAPDVLPPSRPRWVAYQRVGFRARARDTAGPLVGGMVAIAKPGSSWPVVSIDPEHALGGIEEAARGALGGGLPALRTAGLLLLNPSLQGDLEARAAASTSARSVSDRGETEPPLWAEDLVLGYRVDAKEQGGRWHSLTARRGTYWVNELVLLSDRQEEGQTKVNAGMDHGDNRLQTTQVVVRWDGWSLAAPRPALRPGADATPPTVAGEPPLPFHLKVDLAPEPGSLPRLTFGKDYQLRARVVDLAGGALPLTAVSPDNCESFPPFGFTRHEPVLPPDVVRVPGDTTDYGPGAALLTLVLRQPKDGEAAAVPTAADTERQLTPPQTTFEVADWHGVFARRSAADGLSLVTRPTLTDPAAGGVVTFVRGLPGEPGRDRDDEAWVLGPDGTPTEAVEIPEWPDLPPKQLVLMPKPDGRLATVGIVSTGRFVVWLEPAQEATVEITSYIHSSFLSSFAIKDWIKGTADPAVPGEAPPPPPADVVQAEELLNTGRHPMATPPVLVRVRHAVRRPLSTPRGDPVTNRPERATYVDLFGPGDNPMLGVDAASTISVDVTADWTPEEDLTDAPAAGRPVGRIQVDRGDVAVATLRHELGDTKHRSITYHWTAVSRFRDCYDDADTAPDDFTVTGTVGPVHVLSSAQPPPPVVRSIVPNFLWTDDGGFGESGVHTRKRLGNRVRLQLGPWYASGDGERLAVIVGPADASYAGPVTQCGRDPILTMAVPPRFPTPVGDIASIPTPVGAARAQLVTAWRSGEDWYADVAFQDVASYGALVQLAVMRYQPFSIRPDVASSQVVLTDFVPLLPDRELVVTPAPFGAGVSVRLGGHPGEESPANQVDAVLEQLWTTGPLPGGQPATVADDGVWVQVATASGGLGNDLALAGGSGTLRVRVREVELLAGPEQVVLGTKSELTQRVVFTDTVAVPPM